MTLLLLHSFLLSVIKLLGVIKLGSWNHTSILFHTENVVAYNASDGSAYAMTVDHEPGSSSGSGSVDDLQPTILKGIIISLRVCLLYFCLVPW